jgi:hypothetical protein
MRNDEAATIFGGTRNGNDVTMLQFFEGAGNEDDVTV